MPSGFDPRDAVESHKKLYANQFSDGMRARKYMLFDRPPTNPLIMQHGTVAAPAVIPTAPSALVDALNTVVIPGAFGLDVMEMYQTTAQSAMPSRHATKGLLAGGDLVDNESIEYVPGGNHGSNPLGYLAGTDGGVFLRVTLEIADVSGSDQLVIGYRKQEAYQVPVSFLSAGDALYTDFIGIGFSGSANPNDLKTVRDISNGGSTTVFDTGFNWADGLIHTLEIQLKGRQSRFLLNNRLIGDTIRYDALGAAITAQPTSTPPVYTVTSGLFMIPFMFFRYDAAAPGAIYIRKLVCGSLAEDGLAPELR